LATQVIGQDPAAPVRETSVADIVELVLDRYNVRLSDLQGKRRNRSFAFPRQICMYLARALTPLSLEEIGGYFGGRDHSTVLHAVRTIQKQREIDGELRVALDQMLGAAQK